MKIIKKNTIYYFTIFLSLLIIFGSIIYKLYSFNKIGTCLTFLLSLITYIILLKKIYYKEKHEEKIKTITEERSYNKESKDSLFLKLSPLLFLTATTLCFSVLLISRTDSSLISPWEVIPLYFFLFYFLSAFFLIFYSFSKKPNIILYSIFYFLSFSVALIIYKIGYGFDSFIHQSTEELINEKGIVDPKPFYYLGQYSLIVLIHKITTIPISLLDKIIVPLLSAIILPGAIYTFLKNCYKCKKTNFLFLVFALLIPFSFFIVTTPQNLSYLFLILTVFYGLTCKNDQQLLVVYLFALASLAIHPLSGIPAVLFVILIHIYHSRAKAKKLLYLGIFILSSIIFPLLFSYLNKTPTQNPEAEIITKENIINLPEIIIPQKENFIINFIYLYGFNLKIIIFILGVIGIYIAIKNKKECKIYFLSLLMSVSLLFSFFFLKYISFDYLIDYERNDYQNRILFVSVIFLLPFIFNSLYAFIYKTLEQKKPIKYPLIFFLLLMLSTSLYLSYPRFDKYHNSRGYSTGINDLKAVEYIEKNSKNDYIVLANQQVSAAALKNFGFSRYLKNKNNEEIYFYPIPTGGELYRYYLEMVYEKPTKENMLKAMEFSKVSEAYFVLNKYWWAFPKILEEAKIEADQFTDINEEVYIFKYLKD
jgi:hypothetical protein